MRERHILLALTFLFLTRVHSPGVLVDFGLAQSPPGSGIENAVQVFIDNFTPTTSMVVGGMQFKTVEAYGAPSGQSDNGKPWDGTLDFRIYSDNGGNLPDFNSEIMLNPHLSSKTKVGTRSDGWYDYYLYTVTFAAPVTLGANQQYWLGTHLSANYDRDAIFFASYSKATADPLLSNFSNDYYSGNYANAWTHDLSKWATGNSPTGLGFALNVTLIPEPSGVALMGVGLSLAAWFRQRRNFSVSSC